MKIRYPITQNEIWIAIDTEESWSDGWNNAAMAQKSRKYSRSWGVQLWCQIRPSLMGMPTPKAWRNRIMTRTVVPCHAPGVSGPPDAASRGRWAVSPPTPDASERSVHLCRRQKVWPEMW